MLTLKRRKSSLLDFQSKDSRERPNIKDGLNDSLVSTKWRKSMFWLCRSCNRQTHSHSTYLGCKSNQIRFEIWENRINGQYSSFLLSNTIDAELMRKIENFLQILNFKSVKTFLFSLKLWHKPFVPLQDNLLRQDSFQDGKKQFWQFWFVIIFTTSKRDRWS